MTAEAIKARMLAEHWQRRALQAEQQAEFYRERLVLLERLIAELAAAATNKARVA